MANVELQPFGRRDLYCELCQLLDGRNAAGRTDVGTVLCLDSAVDSQLAFGPELLGRWIVNEADAWIGRTEGGAVNSIRRIGSCGVPEEQSITGRAETEA